MREVQFLLNEHVPHALRDGVKPRWPHISVWTVGDPWSPARGSGDPDILAWCEENDFLPGLPSPTGLSDVQLGNPTEFSQIIGNNSVTIGHG